MLLDHLLTSRRAGAPPLRVALLLDGTSLRRPFAAILEHLSRCDFATLALVVHERPGTNGAEPDRATPVLGALRSVERRHLLYDLFRRWDASRTEASRSALLGRVDVSERLAAAPALTVTPLVVDGALSYPEEAVARARQHGIDVALRLAAGRLGGPALALARHGVWSYQLGEVDGGAPASFWTLAEKDPVYPVSLRADLAGRASTLVLARGFADTLVDSSFSPARNEIKPLLLGSTFFIRKLKQLHEEGFAALEADAAPAGPERDGTVRHGLPSNAEVARVVLPRLVARPARRLLKAGTLTRWRIGVRVDAAPRFGPGQFQLDGVRWLEPPQGHARADPVLFERGGRTYCFFEDIDLALRRGSLACAVLDERGDFQEIRPVLQAPYHLSYPFVFEDGGEVFLVPESGQNRTVDLYRAVDFPTRWEKVKTLLDAPGLDTTVLKHAGLYWFFVAVREPAGASEQLLLYSAETLTGPLRFHPKNPVNSDVRLCRPAGPIFEHEGRLIRPSQDCSGVYGRQLNFNEIVRLDPHDYAERLTNVVQPPRGMTGIHTYGRCGRFEVFDGKRLDAIARHLTVESALRFLSSR